MPTESLIQYDRHTDDDFIDEVKVETVPRWKESELSGDEWRFSARVTFWRKGVEVMERSFRDIATAAAWLAWGVTTYCEDMPFDEFQRINDATAMLCANPGCRNEATVTYRIKQDFCVGVGNCGQQRKMYDEHRIRFCERHARRGDCDLKDADANYERVED
jgi:hypothetical protein